MRILGPSIFHIGPRPVVVAGPAPDSPILYWLGDTTDNTPNFTCYLTGVSASDSVWLQYSNANTFIYTTNSFNSVDAGEISNKVLSFSGFGNLTNGTHFFRARHSRASQNSDWSNIETVIVNPSVVVLNTPLYLHDAGNENISYRTRVRINAPSPISSMRAKFMAGIGGEGLHCDNVSVGTNVEGPNTLAIPVELTFSGGSGFNVAAGATAQSDWISLDIPSGWSNLVFVMDVGSTFGGSAWQTTDANCYTYYRSTNNSYNLANVSSFSVFPAGYLFVLTEIEVQPQG
jgi:hypothetical protein